VLLFEPHSLNSFGVCKSKNIINNVRHLTAKVAAKVVVLSPEASIRTDLIFDDADEIDSLTKFKLNFDAIQHMGF
ncbi:hypothetical protein Tco_1181043, partial [Tanacetum coccineum]